MIIQIYAFTQYDEVHNAMAAGVDHIGFVVGDYGIVHGELDFHTAAGLIKEVIPPAKSVALTMSTVIDEILHMADIVQPDIIHISSETDAINVDQMAELRQKLDQDIQLMKAIAVIDQTSIKIAVQYSKVAQILLLDTKIGNLPGVGATGKTHDWTISRKIVVQSQVPVILAGGLSPENVTSAIQAVHPWGVDSNTLTNLEGSPYLKDIGRIRSFVKAVRSIQTGAKDETL